MTESFRVRDRSNHLPGRILVGGALLLCLITVPFAEAFLEAVVRPLPTIGQIVVANGLLICLTATLLSAVGYLTTWLALGPEPFGHRCLIAWGTSLLGTAFFMAGLKVVNRIWNQELFTIAGVVVWVLLCVQGPLWVLRYSLRRRLVTVNVAEAPERWTLQNWGVGAAILSAALAFSRPIFASTDGAIIFLSAAAYMAIAQLLLLPPVFYVLSERRPRDVHARFALHLGLALAPLLGLLLVPSIPRFVTVYAATSVGVILLGIYGGIWALRCGGYRLIRDAGSGIAVRR